jgi:hypothetical protein
MTMDVRRAAASAVPWPDTVSRTRPLDRAPAASADKAGATASGDVESSLRTAAQRRDAAPAGSAAAPAVPTTAEQLAFQRTAAITPTSLTVTTALAAYAAATATAPPRAATSAGAAAPHGRPAPPRDGEAGDAAEPYGGLLSALFGAGRRA